MGKAFPACRHNKQCARRPLKLAMAASAELFPISDDIAPVSIPPWPVTICLSRIPGVSSIELFRASGGAWVPADEFSPSTIALRGVNI